MIHSLPMIRPQLNRVLAAVALLVALPAIAVGEHLRRGGGRAVARRTILIAARLCGVTFELGGTPVTSLPSPAVYTPNHSSPMDIAAMLAIGPQTRFVAAAELFRIPLLASAMRALGTVPLERRDPALARSQLEALVEECAGRTMSLVIFPQGGIGGNDRALPFKSGAFALATRTGAPVIPVAIHRTADVLPPRHHLAIRPGVVTVEFLEEIDTGALTLDDRHALRDDAESSVLDALARPEVARP